jgi:hypothetical protein
MNEGRQAGNGKSRLHSQAPAGVMNPNLQPAWLQFIRYCNELGYGEIEKLKIQDGLPMIAELAVKKIRFAP